MKNVKLLISVLLLITLITSCEKDDTYETDDRDKFIGTWEGTVSMSVPGLGMSSSDPTTQTITKATDNPKQIIFNGANEPSRAYVNGNSYEYDMENTQMEVEGVTISFTVTGHGSISGNLITEGGTIKVHLSGRAFFGSWSSTLYKK